MITLGQAITNVVTSAASAYCGPAFRPFDGPWGELYDRCESPIEKKMCLAIHDFLGYEARTGQFTLNSIPPQRAGALVFGQQVIDRFRADFLIVGFARGNPSSLIIVECDGREFHDAERDALRDWQLSDLGFSTVRFTGSEIYRGLQSTIWRIAAAMDRHLALAIAAEYGTAAVANVVDFYHDQAVREAEAEASAEAEMARRLRILAEDWADAV